MPRTEDLSSRASTDAVVVLGCTVYLDAAGRLAPSALRRRIEFAARVWCTVERQGAAGSEPLCIASGGRHWAGRLEADVMARELEHRGVAPVSIVRERCSLTTADNARFCAAVLERRGLRSVHLVTCEWHLRRAVALFEGAGLAVVPVAVRDAAPVPWRRKVWRETRERLWSWAHARSTVEWASRTRATVRAPSADPSAPDGGP